MRIVHYVSDGGHDHFQEWMDGLRDLKVRTIIQRRLDRLELGHFGDCRSVGQGVWELRIDFGPGYRIYYALAGAAVVLLICGGDKGSQARDITRAIRCWHEWKGNMQ